MFEGGRGRGRDVCPSSSLCDEVARFVLSLDPSFRDTRGGKKVGGYSTGWARWEASATKYTFLFRFWFRVIIEEGLCVKKVFLLVKVLKWVEWVILLYVLSPWSVDDTTLHILQVFFSHLTRGLSSFFLTFSPPPFEFDYNLSLHFTTYDLRLMTCDGWILRCHANIGLLGVATYMLLGVIHVSGL